MPAALERTLVLVKTDGVARGLTGAILARLERAGLRIAALKMVQADRERIDRHYPADVGWLGNVGSISRENLEKHKLSAKEIFGTEDPVEIGRVIKKWNCDYLTAGPLVAVVLEGVGAAANVRRLVGNTLPALAAPGTIRGDYSGDDSVAAAMSRRSIRNLVHASGNAAEAEEEIRLWFAEGEIHPGRNSDDGSK